MILLSSLVFVILYSWFFKKNTRDKKSIFITVLPAVIMVLIFLYLSGVEPPFYENKYKFLFYLLSYGIPILAVLTVFCIWKFVKAKTVIKIIATAIIVILWILNQFAVAVANIDSRVIR